MWNMWKEFRPGSPGKSNLICIIFSSYLSLTARCHISCISILKEIVVNNALVHVVGIKYRWNVYCNS